jgi:predicted dehydrogenase
MQDSYGAFPQVVDNVMCIARYTGGIACQLWESKAAPGHRNGLRVRVYGTQGSAEWFQMEPEMLRMSDNRGGTMLFDRGAAGAGLAMEERYTRFKAGHPAGFIEAFANYYYDIADSLIAFDKSGTHGSPFVFGAETAEEGMLMCEAMARSSHSKRWERVEC